MPDEIPFLDRMLTPARAAEWLGISERELGEKQRKGQIPGAKIGHKTIRYHPRTVITQLALDRGVSPKVIAAMFSQPADKS
jgi:hypothetical protein